MSEANINPRMGFDQRPMNVQNHFEGETGRFIAVNLLRIVAAGSCLAGVGIGAALGIRKVIQLSKHSVLPIRRTIGIGGGSGAAGGALSVLSWLTISLYFQRKYNKSVEAVPIAEGTGSVDGRPRLKLGEFAPCRIEGPLDEHQAVESKLELIRSAEYTIRWAQAFAGGPTLDRALDVLEAQLAQREALQVRFMFNGDVLRRSDRKRLCALAERYPTRFFYLVCKPQILVYPRVRRIEHHVKLMVVDANRFQVGGTEDFSVKDPDRSEDRAGGLFANVGGTGGLVDVDIQGEGWRMGELLTEQFDELWRKWSRIMGTVESSGSFGSSGDNADALESSPVDVPVALHLYSPDHGEQNGWIDGVSARLKAMKAGDTVWIGNMCFNEERVIRLIADAASRGVLIKVVTNGRRGADPLSNVMHGPLNRSHYAELGPNAEIYEYPKDERLYHKKVWVFCPADDIPTVFIGSANISGTSAVCDDEIMLEIRSEELAEKFVRSLRADIGDAAPVSAEKVRKYAHGWNRFETFALEQIFHYVVV